MAEPVNLEAALLAADEAGVKLEMVEGIPMWEAFPAIRHMRAVNRIARAISETDLSREKGCACIHYEDIYVAFPDGSFKRPDIAIFCREPDEQDTAVTLLPEAVVEIISRGYEAKDLQFGVPFYLKQGVKDVIVVNPYDGVIKHFVADVEAIITPGATLLLKCGCAIAFPGEDLNT